MGKWNRFIYQAHKDVLLWLLVVVFLFLFRLVFVAIFHTAMQTTSGARDISLMAFLGLRYDVKFASFWIFVPLVVSVVCAFTDRGVPADAVRWFMGAAFSILASFVCVLSIPYFREYHDHYNYLMFNAYYDDTTAIVATIWAQYHPLGYLFLISMVSASTLAVMRRVVRHGVVSRERLASWTSSPIQRGAAVVLILVLLSLGLNGGVCSKALHNRNDAVTRDDLLNKAVANPFISLARAYADFYSFSGKTGIDTYLPDRDVRKAARSILPSFEPAASLDDYFRRTAAGLKGVRPQHVILVVIESFDAWPLLPEYRSLHLQDNLADLAKKGLHVTNFVPAANYTMQSLSTILTSIPYTNGVEMNYQATAGKEYPSSLVAAFNRLGYKTRFFYGGFLSWERSNDFLRNQGFSDVYGGPHVQEAIGKVEWTEWGVFDEYLYQFVAKTIKSDQPSFNVILTTVNHPPFDLDAYAKGYRMKSVPPDLAASFDGSLDLKTLSNLWYSDHALGAFAREAEEKLPGVLIAVTGDHWSRRFINARPTFFERSSVPFVLYGKDVLRGVSVPPGAAGSHLDIAPTLIELAAPKGFVYHAMGKDMLAPHAHSLGIGYHNVIGPDFIADLETGTFHPVPGKPLPSRLPDIAALKTTLNNYYGVGWWRVKRGADLGTQPAPSAGSRSLSCPVLSAWAPCWDKEVSAHPAKFH